MPYAIILGDVHLGKGINIGKAGVGASLNSRVTDQLNLLEWTLDRALYHTASHIIITGDVFEDPKPHPALMTLFIGWLKKCEANGINVDIIMGNHDILRSGFIYNSPLDIISEFELDNITVHKQISTIFIESTAFTLVPFRDRKSFFCNTNQEALALLKDSFVYELASIPVTYKKVMVGHLAIEGSIPIGDEIDDITNELFCTIDMFTGYDKVWMGHVHKPQIMSKNPYIAHTGSMDISNFGENDHKKQIVVLDCITNKFTLEDIPTRQLKKIVITVPKDTVDTTAYVLKQLESEDTLDRSIVKVEVAFASPDLKSINKGSIEKFLMKQGAFNVTNISESKKIAIIKKDNAKVIDTKMDVLSAIQTYSELYVDDKIRGKFVEVANSLYADYKEENESN